MRKNRNLLVLRSLVKKYTLNSFEQHVDDSHSLTHEVLVVDGDVTEHNVSYSYWDSHDCIVRFVKSDPVTITCSFRNFEQ